MIDPKLLAEQFDENQKAEISVRFAGHAWDIEIGNVNKKEYGMYSMKSAVLDGNYALEIVKGRAILPLKKIQKMDERICHRICVELD